MHDTASHFVLSVLSSTFEHTLFLTTPFVVLFIANRKYIVTYLIAPRRLKHSTSERFSLHAIQSSRFAAFQKAKAHTAANTHASYFCYILLQILNISTYLPSLRMRLNLTLLSILPKYRIISSEFALQCRDALSDLRFLCCSVFIPNILTFHSELRTPKPTESDHTDCPIFHVQSNPLY